MKLIHCADLHLDSPMGSNLTAAKAKERRNEILTTFSSLIEHADQNGAAAILIAGDLFDSSRTTRKTLQYVLSLIKAHPDLYFFYLPGNHDGGVALAAEGELPDNLKLFGETWSSYDFDEVMITGASKPDPETLHLPADRLNILLLHGQAQKTGTAKEDAIPFSRYKNRNIDYMALGHVHTITEASLDSRGIACYSGCLEGRGFDECGKKGYILLEIENRRISHEFVPFARRTLHEITCDMTDHTTQLEAEEAVRAAVADIPKKDLVKVILTGTRPPDDRPELSRIEKLLSDEFYFAKVCSDIRLQIRPEDYSHDISLKGEFVRRVMASELSDTEKERIIACGFQALIGEELDI